MFRNLLFIFGGLFILAGLALGYMLIESPEPPPETAKAPEPVAKAAVLVASHSIASGTLLQAADIVWKDIAPDEVRSDDIVRGRVPESEFLGAMAKRDFQEGEPLAASGFLKLSDPRFLAAALIPGHRAISLPVDAAQSASGLLLPGNHVDLILTQNITDPSWQSRRKIVSETFLRDVRVIAVDQTLSQQPKAAILNEAKIPKLVTLEVTETQAQKVFVALQLGTIQLSVRPLEGHPGEYDDQATDGQPTWAFDVSTALKEMMRARRTGPPASPAVSPLVALIRRPPKP